MLNLSLPRDRDVRLNASPFRRRALAAGLLLAGVAVARADEPVRVDVTAGRALYQLRCAVCHDHAQEQIPPRAVLSSRPREHIIQTLQTGVMKPQAEGLSERDFVALADYLISMPSDAAGSATLAEYPLHANMAKGPAPAFVMDAREWNGWSPDLENTRLQKHTNLNRGNVAQLAPKWVFAYPGGRVLGPPSVSGGRVFIGALTGAVFCLDAQTGATYWAIKPSSAGIKTAVVVQECPEAVWRAGTGPRFAAYFGDTMGTVYAVNAETGDMWWTTRPESHPYAGIAGSFKLHDGRLYVPIMTSREGGAAMKPDYPGCTLRGSVVVLDALTGKRVWQGFTIKEEPKPYKKNAFGTQQYGPAGASVWSPPTIDPAGGKVYATTGQSRTSVPEDGSDAMMAFDFNSGERLWSMQATANDAWNPGCNPPSPGPNCPDVLGPDVDFGSPSILKTLGNGKRILISAQKSGMVHALDPDGGGKAYWRTNLAKDANIPPGVVLRDRENPGVVFGLAADDTKIYAAIADPSKKIGHIPLGVYALDLKTGAIAWRTPGPPVGECGWGKQGCTGAQRTAVTLIPGVAFAGSANGHMYAYNTDDGHVIWDFDTGRSFPAVNGPVAQGGSIEGSATIVSGDSVFVMSGYASYGGGQGNALICFTLNGR
jgi:polyvinyl alcohol dehydrogenase (cytochrome)